MKVVMNYQISLFLFVVEFVMDLLDMNIGYGCRRANMANKNPSEQGGKTEFYQKIFNPSTSVDKMDGFFFPHVL